MSIKIVLRICLGTMSTALVSLFVLDHASALVMIALFLSGVFLLIGQWKLRRLISLIITRLGNPNLDQVNEATVDRLTLQLASARQDSATIASEISNIGEPLFAENVSRIKDNHVRQSLLDTHHKILEYRERETRQSWVSQNTAAIADLNIDASSLVEYADNVISTIVKAVGASQGAFFLIKREGDNEFFQLAASYAYGKKKYLDKRVNLGEGLIGQAYYDTDTIYITDVPKDYLKITSGLGEALPRSICVVPLRKDGKMYGAIEVASFQKLAPHDIEYLKKSAEFLAANVHSMEVHAHTESLLQESLKMTQEIKSQEEELRQNVEELTTTQELINRKQQETDAVLATLCVVELDMEGVIQAANHVFCSITGHDVKALVNKRYSDLIPTGEADRKQFAMMWNSVQSGQTFSGEFKLIDNNGNETWMTGNFTPLLESGKPYKVLMVSLFNTREKEKLLELNDLFTAMKECFPIAEMNSDMTFKTANELFLAELGIKRLELKSMGSRKAFFNGSFERIERHFESGANRSGNVEISLCTKDGLVKSYQAAMLLVNANQRQKKGFVILKNQNKTKDYASASTE